MDLDLDMSIPKPIKVEDWTFIDLDFDIHEWIKTVDNKLSDYNSCWSEESLDKVMKWYIESLKREATNILKMASICKKHMQRRMLFFYICESDINLQRSTFSKSYFDNMEDILAFYINVEIYSGLLKKQNTSRNYKLILRKTARRIINMLNHYLCLRDTLQDNFIRKHHVLMKMEINDKSTETRDLLNILYEKLLTVFPKNKSDLAFCRSYILYQKWKIFRDPSDWLKMNELLYKMYDRTPNTIEGNPILKQILLSKKNSILDVLTHISNNHVVMAKEYFKFIQGDECPGDSPVPSYHIPSTFAAPDIKPSISTSKAHYLDMLSGLTISNNGSITAKQESPNAKVLLSAEETSKPVQSKKAVRSGKVQVPNRITKPNRTKCEPEDDDVQIVNCQTVKYVYEIPDDDDLCEIVYAEIVADPADTTNNKSFLDSIDISEQTVKEKLQRKNTRNLKAPNNNRFRPKVNKSSPNKNLLKTSKQNGPVEEVIDLIDLNDSDTESMDVGEEIDSKKRVIEKNSVSTGKRKQKINDNIEVCTHAKVAHVTTETQTDTDKYFSNNNDDKRDYPYKNHYGLVTPPSDQHSEEPDSIDRPLVYMERVASMDTNKASTPLFLSQKMERIQDGMQKASSDKSTENDVEEQTPMDTILTERVSKAIPTTGVSSNDDNGVSSNDDNSQPTENDRSIVHNSELSHGPEVNHDVNVAESTGEGSLLVQSSISNTANDLAKSLAQVRLSPVFSNVSTVSHENQLSIENTNNTPTPGTCVSKDNHPPEQNPEFIETTSANKPSQSNIEPIEPYYIEKVPHTSTVVSITSEKSNEVNGDRDDHSNASETLTESVTEQENIGARQLIVSLEKISITEPQPVKSVSTPEQNDSGLFKDYSDFDAPSTIMNDCYTDHYMDSILSGPLEKPGVLYEHINPDKSFDLFDNRICSTPIEPITPTNTDLPIVNSEITSPLYEGIDDFRKFYEDNKNTQRLNNIETVALPQSPDQASSVESPFISLKPVHSYPDNTVEVRLPNSYQEYPNKYSPVPANNNKRKLISFADPGTEMDLSGRPLLTSLKPNGVLQSVFKKPYATPLQIKRTTRPRIPRRLLNMKSLASYNMQPNDLYLQSEPYVEIIKLRQEELAQALRINIGLQAARKNRGAKSVMYRVDYDKQASLNIGTNDIVQFNGKKIPLTAVQEHFQTHRGGKSPSVKQKIGYNPAGLANVGKKFGKRKRRGCSPTLEANAEDVSTVSSRPLSSRSGRILKPILRMSMVPKKTDKSLASKR